MLQHCAMPEMDTVEVPNAQHRVAGRIVATQRISQDVHAATLSSPQAVASARPRPV
jgi:hypothetical protein